MVPWGHSDMEIAVGNAISLGTSTVPAIPHGKSQLILDKGGLFVTYDPALDPVGICIEKRKLMKPCVRLIIEKWQMDGES